MADNANEEVSASLAKARAATGIEEGAEKPSEETETSTETDTPETENKSTKSKTSEAKSEEEGTDDEEEGEEESEDGEEEESEDSTSEKNPPTTKKRSPLKAAFTQINLLRKGQDALEVAFVTGMKDLTAAIKDLQTARTPSEKTEAKKEAKETMNELIEKAGKAGADPEWLKTFASTMRDVLKEEIDKSITPLKTELDSTKKTATELSDDKAKADRLKKESGAFLGEWQGLMPTLARTYPNATPQMLADARAEMQKLATSKEYGGESLDGTENKGKQPMPLDYILFKERQKFDTLLKVKSGKSGETGGRDVGEEEEDEEVDLTPDNMTFEKFKKHMANKRKHYEASPIEIIG